MSVRKRRYEKLHRDAPAPRLPPGALEPPTVPSLLRPRDDDAGRRRSGRVDRFARERRTYVVVIGHEAQQRPSDVPRCLRGAACDAVEALTRCPCRGVLVLARDVLVEVHQSVLAGVGEPFNICFRWVGGWVC